MGHRGPRCIYRPKEPPNIALAFAARTQRLLAATARRLKQSRSNVVEHLLRRHAGTLGAEDFPARLPKIRPNTCVSLTAFAKQVLDAAATRTGRNRADVVEALIERFAADVTREEFKITEAA